MNKKLIAAAVSAAVMAPVAAQADLSVYGPFRRINNIVVCLINTTYKKLAILQATWIGEHFSEPAIHLITCKFREGKLWNFIGHNRERQHLTTAMPTFVCDNYP